MNLIRTHLLPAHVEPSSLANSTAVVIDVLRATSTITTALVHGAACVIPCETIEEALEQHRLLNGECELCGERSGAKIDGFDRGNSPSEYLGDLAREQTLVFTTTNGTRAMLHSRLADEVLLASFLNLQAVIDRLRHKTRIEIVCSGTNGVTTYEDELLAGAIAFNLADSFELDSCSAKVAESWKQVSPTEIACQDLVAHLQKGQGGINLMKRGFDADIEFCSQIDLFDAVCQYDPNENLIRLSSS